MRVVEPVSDLRRNVGGFLHRHLLRVAQHVLQRAALQQLHRDVRHAVLLAHVIDLDDVRVVQPPGGFRFAQEPHAHLPGDVLGQVRVERLDRDLALDERIEGAIDRANRAAAEFSQHPVTAEHHCWLIRSSLKARSPVLHRQRLETDGRIACAYPFALYEAPGAKSNAPQKCGAARPAQRPTCSSRISFSAWARSIEASISSRLIETLSTLTPSGTPALPARSRIRFRLARQISIDCASGFAAPKIVRAVSSGTRTPSHCRKASVFSRPTGEKVRITRRGSTPAPRQSRR